jgi:hypothetical protein
MWPSSLGKPVHQMLKLSLEMLEILGMIRHPMANNRLGKQTR